MVNLCSPPHLSDFLTRWKGTFIARYEFLFLCIALGCFSLNFAASLTYLVARKDSADALAVASVKAGLIYCSASLITAFLSAGSNLRWIQNRIFMMGILTGLLYACYLFLRRLRSPGRGSALSVFAIFAFLDIPFVYLAVSLQTRGARATLLPRPEFALYIPGLLAFLMLAALGVAAQYRRARAKQLNEEESVRLPA